jgi:Ser/Thr protein kinase RdoA (MazF antagonist)
MLPQIDLFQIDAPPIYCDRYGSGHINHTYLIVDGTARQYILQKINQHVFRAPASLMKNIAAVTTHLRKTAATWREVLELIPTKAGDAWLVDDEGEYWRMYQFISDSVSLQLSRTENDFRESALAFGRFQRQLADFPAHELAETIPNFHNTPVRYQAFHEAIKTDKVGRVKEVQREIDFVLERESYASTLTNLQASGDMPLRVTHNDTKLNNVLFDRETDKALCVIDLDTVMPGLSVNDFGDSIRFGATSAAEDERDLSKVNFVLPLYETYKDGFLAACGESLTTCEKESLRDGAKMMTLECGMRFLTDYISGDVYFHITRETSNMDRSRTQFKLVADMEKIWDKLI